MNVKRFKVFSIFCALVFVAWLIPASVWAASDNGGTITVIFGETAQLANATLWHSNKAPAKSPTILNNYSSDFEMGALVPNNYEYVFCNKDGHSSGYTLQYWELTKQQDGTQYKLYNGDGTVVTIGGSAAVAVETNVSRLTDNTESAVYLKFFYATEGDWTLEPIFVKVSPYTVYLTTDTEFQNVDAGTEVNISLNVSGGSYNCISATVTYDSSLFYYDHCSDSLTVDATEDGKLLITAEGLDKAEYDSAGTLVFVAKAVSEAGQGSFSVVEGTKVDVSQRAISENALEAKKGQPLTLGVNAATDIKVRIFNEWVDEGTVAYREIPCTPGGNITQDLNSYIIEGYNAQDYVYSFSIISGGEPDWEVRGGTLYINNIDRNIDIMVSRQEAIPGQLAPYYVIDGEDVGLKIFGTTYEVVKFTPTTAPEEGNTLFYGDEKMVKIGDNTYICIIGELGTEATRASITEKEGEALVMSYKGDVNQTDYTDINDAQLIDDIWHGVYVYGSGDVEMVKYLAADVNVDGSVSSADITMVISDPVCRFEY